MPLNNEYPDEIPDYMNEEIDELFREECLNEDDLEPFNKIKREVLWTVSKECSIFASAMSKPMQNEAYYACRDHYLRHGTFPELDDLPHEMRHLKRAIVRILMKMSMKKARKALHRRESWRSKI